MGNKQNSNEKIIDTSALSTEQYIKWFYENNDNKQSDWSSYSDIETAIIEEAFQNKLSEVILDHCSIDLNNLIEISNLNNKRSIKRILYKHKQSMREQRFEASQLLPMKTPFYGSTSAFIEAIWVHYQLFYTNTSPYTDDNSRKILVEKAGEGILIEGQLIDKQKEAQWIAQQLINIKNGTIQEVYSCCAHLYTMESFLYKKINYYMNLVINQENEQIWKSKITTYGPFIYLLYILGQTKGKHILTVYQGTNLSEYLIEQYQQQYQIGLKDADQRIQYPSFTIATKNQMKAELFGNTLFIIEIAKIDGSNISSYSDYDEEEYLINPGFLFSVQSCTFDQNKQKWIINLQSYSTAGNWCEG